MKNKKIHIGIVASEFNQEITDSLLECCLEELRSAGLQPSQWSVVRVPGAYELPFMVKELIRQKKCQAVITLGCIIKGETSHDQHIATWVSTGLGQISLETRVPVLFGVLTPHSYSQAKRRSRKGPLNRGKEVAEAALKMIHILQHKGT